MGLGYHWGILINQFIYIFHNKGFLVKDKTQRK